MNIIRFICLLSGVFFIATVVHMEGTQFWLAVVGGVCLAIYVILSGGDN